MLLSLFERRPQANSRRYASLTCLVIQTMQKHANGRYLLAIQLQFTSYSFGHQWNGASFLIQRILPAYYFRNSYPQSYQHNPQEQRPSKGDGGFCFKKQLGGARARQKGRGFLLQKATGSSNDEAKMKQKGRGFLLR